jgi:hypothetical protein
LLTVISCCVFAARSFGTQVHRSKRYPFWKSTRSSSPGGGAAKYAWLSVRRGYFRSFIPFAVSMCAVILLAQLTYTAQLYESKLDVLNENTAIKGHFTDVSGKQIDGLTVFGYIVHDLYRSGMVSEVSMSKRESYLYFGDLGPYVSENEYGSVITIPSPSSFAYETYLNRLKQEPGIISTNDLSSVPEFYYSSNITTQFLDGYDASFLAGEMTSLPSCMVSTHFMEKHGVKLGDTITVAVTSGRGYKICDLYVAGSYVKAGKEDNIYCQLGYYIPLDNISSPEFMAAKPRSYTFDCVSFTLNDTGNLTAFKEYLSKAGYSEVNTLRKIRCFPVLEDHNFLTTQSSMIQRIWYIDHTFPVIYVAVELLAGLIPFILVRLRKREVAIMRSLGASYRTSFFSMFLEQAILCLAGSAAGIAVWLAANGTPSRLGTMLVVTFMICWLAGTAVSLWNMMVSAVRAILRAEE